MADEDKAGVYTVELAGHMIGSGWTTVMANSAVEAAEIGFDQAARHYNGEGGGRPLEEDGDDVPDGEPVLIVRAVAGFHGPIADDLAEAIR
jgi:hypothetical protein